MLNWARVRVLVFGGLNPIRPPSSILSLTKAASTHPAGTRPYFYSAPAREDEVSAIMNYLFYHIDAAFSNFYL